MAKVDAYGSVLKIGTNQVETVIQPGACDGTGNISVTITASGMSGSGGSNSVAVTSGDTAESVAQAIYAYMIGDGDVTALFTPKISGVNVSLTRIVAIANDATMDITIADGTGSCTGYPVSSSATTAGVALATVAQVISIGGPSLSLDTYDVTCHDSTDAFEQVVGGVLRSGELALGIVYDPAEDTHDATAGAGILSRLEEKIETNFSLVFPDAGSTTWAFNGLITGFESDAPHDGALSAAVTIKVDGSPTLV